MTTKQCSNCGSTDLVLLRSLNEKRCAECKAVIPWPLDGDQAPLINNNRIRDRESDETNPHSKAGTMGYGSIRRGSSNTDRND